MPTQLIKKYIEEFAASGCAIKSHTMTSHTELSQFLATKPGVKVVRPVRRIKTDIDSSIQEELSGAHCTSYPIHGSLNL
jgi:hypothetical protein